MRKLSIKLSPDVSKRLSIIFTIFTWLSSIILGSLGIFYAANDKFQQYVQNSIFNGAKDNAVIFIAYVGVIFSAIWAVFFIVVYKMNAFIRRIDTMQVDTNEKNFIKGNDALADDLLDEIPRRDPLKHATIDIICYTLFTVSTQLAEWKDRRYLKKVTFNVYYLDENYITNSPDLDSNWSLQVKNHKIEIEKFKNDNADELKRKKVEINLIPYSHLPAIHGFRLANDTIYFSISLWANKLQIETVSHRCAYLKITSRNKSPFAKEIRYLFNNWLDKAKGDAA